MIKYYTLGIYYSFFSFSEYPAEYPSIHTVTSGSETL